MFDVAPRDDAWFDISSADAPIHTTRRYAARFFFARFQLLIVFERHAYALTITPCFR